ncbi:putative ornithine decarboxylase [Lactobacillus delbrueckii subsp. bulgaricus]|nr:ornithine decarboxylase [Lactobacillus delbrueckii subsp. bulgaricus]MBT8903830.1 ornithine decarboxylase [Lactobacillus delbrueckii subsp. bulgaricus]MBT8917516.1 ornithine decarboxylase [Lactobacillus delbrueckii subsp. bulgaricus]MBT8920587.1 ornithine decarboxylase [Lactobacillus delbrueckii subsp. bulgaricus]MBT8928457.1 ornithine decarboxylase [Lactobacillus delbrueckii subsp. bulgaricus]
MHYLAIAAKKELLPYLPIDWPKTELTELVNPASLAAVVIDEKDSRSRGIYQTMKEKLGLDLPLIEFTPETSPAEISRLAQTYEEANVPRFIRELTAFSDQDDLVFDTPGHHNGRFYDRHPAGAVLRNFFGDNYFRADTSDCVSELGDMMNHTGGPLEAQQEAAKAFNADKVYFCTNGTTSANTICTTALLDEGDLVLFDRNNHKSIYNSALVMTGAKPVYLPTDRNADGLIGPLTAASLDEDLIRREIAKVAPGRAKADRPFRLAVLQLETYDGIFYDAKLILKKLGRLCDYILFDCAWGGYEQFVDVLRDFSPFQQTYGPDDPGILVTQSVHKQQAGVGQASQILKKDSHIKGQKRYVDHKHFNHAYMKYVTTSYSYPVYASLVANSAMAASPAVNSWWNDTVKLGIDFRKRLLKESKLFKPLVPPTVHGQKWENLPTDVLAQDPEAWKLSPDDDWHGFKLLAPGEVALSPVKVTLMTPGIDLAKAAFTEEGIPGAIVSLYLHEKHIIPEKSDSYSTLYLLTPGEGQVDMNGLFSTLMAFEEAYLTKAPLSAIMPELVAQYPNRYEGYTLYQLCQELHHYYQEHEIFKLQQALFLKDSFQNYELTPKEADREFVHGNSELVKLADAKGRMALEGALPYPPGVFIVAPGERWQDLDVAYFQVLIGAARKFPGLDPEIQGVYQEDGEVWAEVLKES